MDYLDKLLVILDLSPDRGRVITTREKGEGDLADLVQTLHYKGVNFNNYVDSRGVNRGKLTEDLRRLEKVGFLEKKSRDYGIYKWNTKDLGYQVTRLGQGYVRSEIKDQKEYDEIKENLSEWLKFFNL